MADFDGLFNWTMTYQHESDVAYIYGRVMPLATAPSPTRRKATLAGLIAASAAQGIVELGIDSVCRLQTSHSNTSRSQLRREKDETGGLVH